MKKYLKDLWHEVKYPLVVAIIASTVLVIAMLKKWPLMFVQVSGIVASFVCCLWGPWCEERFKRSHSRTVNEALTFGGLEFVMYGWQLFVAGPIGYIWLRVPMLVLHSASSMCYHQHPDSKEVFWFWLVMHCMWNSIGTFWPNVILKISSGKLYPTMFTYVLVAIWCTSLVRKLFKEKQAVA